MTEAALRGFVEEWEVEESDWGWRTERQRAQGEEGEAITWQLVVCKQQVSIASRGNPPLPPSLASGSLVRETTV